MKSLFPVCCTCRQMKPFSCLLHRRVLFDVICAVTRLVLPSYMLISHYRSYLISKTEVTDVFSRLKPITFDSRLKS